MQQQSLSTHEKLVVFFQPDMHCYVHFKHRNVQPSFQQTLRLPWELIKKLLYLSCRRMSVSLQTRLETWRGFCWISTVNDCAFGCLWSAASMARRKDMLRTRGPSAFGRPSVETQVLPFTFSKRLAQSVSLL